MNDSFEQVAQVLRRLIAQGYFPCAAVEIGNEKGPVWRFAEGHRAFFPNEKKVNQDTCFDMASVSKVLSATMAALTLFEEGRLSPTDEMGLFWEGLPAASARITVGQLLTHTSGLPGGKSLVGLPKETIEEEILKLPPAYPAGTQVQYACLGFILLGRLLEKIEGKGLDVLARERVFAPLGMKHTGYAPKGENIAATDRDDPGLLGIVNDYNARYLAKPVGNAGVFSNLTDCGIFARMLLHEGEPLVSRQLMGIARKNHTPFADEGRCWGFYLMDSGNNPACNLCSPEAFGHTGWTGTEIMADPLTGMYIVMLTNRTAGTVRDDGAIWRARRYVNNAAVCAWEKAGLSRK